jgi:hypothetical protein
MVWHGAGLVRRERDQARDTLWLCDSSAATPSFLWVPLSNEISLARNVHGQSEKKGVYGDQMLCLYRLLAVRTYFVRIILNT